MTGTDDDATPRACQGLLHPIVKETWKPLSSDRADRQAGLRDHRNLASNHVLKLAGKRIHRSEWVPRVAVRVPIYAGQDPELQGLRVSTPPPRLQRSRALRRASDEGQHLI